MPKLNRRWITALQAFTAGYVDTVGFVGLFGLFTARITGNMVLLGASLAEHSAGLLAKFAAVPTFVLAVVLTTIIVRRSVLRGKNTERTVLWVQALLLALFMTVAILGEPIVDGNGTYVAVAGMLGVTAMAVQNTASQTIFSDLASTATMTANTTELVVDLVYIVDGDDNGERRVRVARAWPAVAAFAAGTIAAGIVFAHFRFHALILPIGIVVILGFLTSETRRSIPLAYIKPE